RGVPVAHKTGSFKGVYHDAAIVEPPGRKPFVIVVLTRGIDDEAAAHKLVAEIARATFEHCNRR
ncbi:serine hydrolase, partial [Singulisphaera rosea]